MGIEARLALGCCALAAVVSSSQPAHAYCRTTTCDPDVELCTADPDGCLNVGLPLYWPDLCVTFGVHENGSPLRGISYARAEQASRNAFQTWISADCGDGRNPSIGVVALGEIVCDRIEYNHDSDGDEDSPPSVAGPNANLIVFRDDNWTYADSKTIALTTITFAVSSGEILDADIEVNSQDIELTTGDTNVKNDLQSVLTHEIGHFFGLAHSRVPGSSMNPDYDRGNLDFRSLSEDDRAGICAIYGPLVDAEPPAEPLGAGGTEPLADADEGEFDCTGEGPRFGFSRYCGSPELADGCSVRGSSSAGFELDALAGVAKRPLRPQASADARHRAQALAASLTRDARFQFGGLALLLGALGFIAWRRRGAR